MFTRSKLIIGLAVLLLVVSAAFAAILIYADRTYVHRDGWGSV